MSDAIRTPDLFTPSESQKRQLFYLTTGFGVVAVTFFLTWRRMVFSTAYLPHLYCYLAKPGLVWAHVAADTLIGFSYLAISGTLCYLVYKGRRDIPFHLMFLAFGLFIVACGMTHFIEVLTIWVPVYVLSASVKVFTAVASISTAAVLPFTVPQILGLIRRAKVAESDRRIAEAALEERKLAVESLDRAHNALERKVHQRTAQLASANASLEIEVEERRRVEEALRESERQYRLFFDRNPLPMWVFDRKTLGFLAVNEAAIHEYGYTREEFLGMTILAIQPLKDIAAVLRAALSPSDGLQTQIWRHVKKDGSIVDVDVTKHDINLRGIDAELVLAHDITQQKRSEEKLRQSEERFSKAFRASPFAMSISTEADGRYLDVNDAFVSLTEYAREEILGSTGGELGIWASFEERGAMLIQLEQPEGAKPVPGRFRRRSGEMRDVQVAAQRIQLESQNCILAVTQDVTEAKLLEHQFLQAQKMEAVGQLAGGISHDFNNLLSVIQGYSELAQQEVRSEHPAHKHIELINQAALRAAALTKQLLAFSRQQVLQPAVLDLNVLVHNLSKMLRRLVGEDISLILKTGHPLGNVKADLGQIEQVLMNLTVNARDAMPEGGKILIETANVNLDDSYSRTHQPVRPGSYVMLSVTDTGCGMDAATISRVFEPFFTTKGPSKGTGLGLSTVYGIVKQSNGYIWVYSEPGQGTAFKIFLPRVEEPASGLTVVKNNTELPTGSEAVLVVEDDEAVRKLTVSILQSGGYRVVEATDVWAAIDLAKDPRAKFDLLLSDVIMPGMNGAELAAQLQSYRRDLKLLFMSGYTGDLIVDRGILNPGTALINKPFSKQALLRKVREVLDEEKGRTRPQTA